MENLAMIGIFVLFVMNAVILYTTRSKKNNENKPEDSQAMQLLLQQVNELSRTVDSKMSESNKLMNESVRSQFGESAKLIREVTEGLTKLDETNKQVISFADQLQSLEDILKNPKQRGILGEYYLETLLQNVFGTGGYECQHRLGKDEEGNELIPDAVIFIKDKKLAIDSKFSLENYNRLVETKDPIERERHEKLLVSDLKNRIVETSKYIQPSLGTMDFAFMFIPHEAIYYDLLINKVGAINDDTESLIERAARKYKVIIVSPTSLLAYIQTVLQGLKAMQIEEKAKDIIKSVGELGKHLKSYEEYYSKLGNTLSTAVNHYTNGGKEFRKIDKDIMRITGESAGIETIAIDKPAIE
ncbi:MAG: DNA recombination protein RmuC [bacterium]|nr:DNA recombination protein RmuC [bacterium]